RLLEPLSLILLVAGIISMGTGDVIGGAIIVMILALSIGLDTVQEGHAVRAAEELRRSVALKARCCATAPIARSMSRRSCPATSCACAPATSFLRTRWSSKPRPSPRA